MIRLGFGKTALLLTLCTVALADYPASTGADETHLDAYGDPLPPHAVLRLGTTRLHHQSSLEDAAFSPDGRTLASTCGGHVGSVALWEMPSGRLLRRFTIRPQDENWVQMNAVAFSPDGGKLLAGDSRGALHLWEVASGREIYALQASSSWPGATAVAFSPDGKWIASGGGDGVVRVWSADAGHELITFDPFPPLQESGNMYRGVFPTGSIAALCFSPDGKCLAAGLVECSFRAKTDKIRIWDIEKNQPVHSLDGPSGFLVSLAYTPDGKQLISGGSRIVSATKLGRPYPYLEAHLAKLRIWDVPSGQLVRQLDAPEQRAGLGALALSSDGRTLAAGYEDKIVVFNVDSSTLRCSIDVPQWRGGRGLAISPDGQIVCAPLGGTIGLWSAVTGESLLANAPSHTSFVSGVAYVSGQDSIVTIGGDTLRV